jgi:hypothetical protein
MLAASLRSTGSSKPDKTTAAISGRSAFANITN